jgi:CPA1 family monovalent cation:H+ antiporter
VELALTVVSLVSVVAAISALGRRWSLPAPLLLVMVGVIASYLPFLPEIHLEPELVLVGLLPPLLYAAAIRTSLIDFRSNRRPIALLSVGLVLVTAVGVGLIAAWLLPIPFPAALALGAVVAPPDAVAATTIARRIGMPRRIITILEGESLVNDATALVALRTALAAFGGGLSLGAVAGDFLLAAGGGVVVGLVVALIVGKIRLLLTETVLDTTVSLITPFLAAILAEQIHASGVLAVVVTGLILGHRAPVIQSAASRISEGTNWRTIQFILENLVFLLIGLQVRSILDEVLASQLPLEDIAGFCLVILSSVMIIRPLWVFPATYLPRLSKLIRRADPAPPWQYPAVISWAGMRGVVTLATVFILPSDIPLREVLVAAALVVTAGTLLIQGFTLPAVVRRLGIRGPDPREDALQEASVLQEATEAGLAELDRIVTSVDPGQIVELIRSRSVQRSNAAWERLGRSQTETPGKTYSRLRLAMLQAERGRVLELRDTGKLADDVLRTVLGLLDAEEATLEAIIEEELERRETELAIESPRGGCEHLNDAPLTAVPKTPEGCQECMATGSIWVHLRLCLTCGQVACCDSSPNRHAAAHARLTGHPVVRSFEPGEAWRWCYPDSQVG